MPNKRHIRLCIYHGAIKQKHEFRILIKSKIMKASIDETKIIYSCEV